MRPFLPGLLTAGLALAAAGCDSSSPNPSSVGTESRETDEDVDFYPPNPTRDLTDLVAGCEGMNPEQRPRGSNCHGIFPEQCGADKAIKHVGSHATPELRATITDYSPGGDVRFIEPGNPVIQDLRYGRLNVELDANDTITDADCY